MAVVMDRADERGRDDGRYRRTIPSLSPGYPTEKVVVAAGGGQGAVLRDLGAPGALEEAYLELTRMPSSSARPARGGAVTATMAPPGRHPGARTRRVRAAAPGGVDQVPDRPRLGPRRGRRGVLTVGLGLLTAIRPAWAPGGPAVATAQPAGPGGEAVTDASTSCTRRWPAMAASPPGHLADRDATVQTA